MSGSSGSGKIPPAYLTLVCNEETDPQDQGQAAPISGERSSSPRAHLTLVTGGGTRGASVYRFPSSGHASGWSGVNRYASAPGEVTFLYEQSAAKGVIALTFDDDIVTGNDGPFPSEVSLFTGGHLRKAELWVGGRRVPLQIEESIARGHFQSGLRDPSGNVICSYEPNIGESLGPNSRAYPARLIPNQAYHWPTPNLFPETLIPPSNESIRFSNEGVHLYPYHRFEGGVQYAPLGFKGGYLGRFIVTVYEDQIPRWAQVHLDGNPLTGLNEVVHNASTGVTKLAIHQESQPHLGGHNLHPINLEIKEGRMVLPWNGTGLARLDDLLVRANRYPLSLDIHPRRAFLGLLGRRSIGGDQRQTTRVLDAAEGHGGNYQLMRVLYHLVGMDHRRTMTDKIRASWIDELCRKRPNIETLKGILNHLCDNEDGYTKLPSGDFEQGRLVGRGLSIGIGAAFKTWANGDSNFIHHLFHDGAMTVIGEGTEKGMLQLFGLARARGFTGLAAKALASGFSSYGVNQLFNPNSEENLKNFITPSLGFGAFSACLETMIGSYFKPFGFYGGLAGTLITIGAPLVTSHVLEEVVS